MLREIERWWLSRGPMAGRPLAAWRWMAAAAVIAAAAIYFTTAWLLDIAGQAAAGTDRARVRVEAVRTGLAAGAGAGAAIGLLLAFRRQGHQEYDNAERRVTELYTAAAEQLASDKAPIRLTALYTLERLANANPRHRQTIVNIICAYLRMPFTPPPTNAEAAHRHAVKRHQVRYRSARAGQPDPAGPAIPDPYEERQVRLTAQRLLATHLRNPARVPWMDVHLDLTDAVLIDFELRDCIIHSVDFSSATFVGIATFKGSTFHWSPRFVETTFAGLTSFDHVTFKERPDFDRTVFDGPARFEKTVFAGPGAYRRGASFVRATFDGRIDFTGASFLHRASFDGALLTDRWKAHVCPPGWQIEPTEGSAGRIAPQ